MGYSHGQGEVYQSGCIVMVKVRFSSLGVGPWLR